MSVHHPSLRSIVTLFVVLFACNTQGVAQESEVASIQAALLEVTRDPDAEVRVTAFTVLSEELRTDAILKAFHRGLGDADPRVRNIALAGLVRLEGATDEIIRLLVLRLADPATTRTAANDLIEIGEPSVPFLIDAANDADTKQQAIQLLGRTSLGDQQAKVAETLIAALEDKNSAVRLEATRSLGRIIRSTGKTDPRLTRGRETVLQQFDKTVLQQFDKNADGALTADEWNSMRTSPILADTNRDGRVTAEEYVKWRSRRPRD